MTDHTLAEDLAVLGTNPGLLAEPVTHWRRGRGRKVHAPHRWYGTTKCNLDRDGLVEVPVSYLDPEPDLCTSCARPARAEGAQELAHWVRALAAWSRVLDSVERGLADGSLAATDAVCLTTAHRDAVQRRPDLWVQDRVGGGWEEFEDVARCLAERHRRCEDQVRSASSAQRDEELENELVADLLYHEACTGHLVTRDDTTPLPLTGWWRGRELVLRWARRTKAGTVDLEDARAAVAAEMHELVELDVDAITAPRCAPTRFATPAEWARAEWRLLVADTAEVLVSRWEARAAELRSLADAPHVVVVNAFGDGGGVDATSARARIEARCVQRWGPVSGGPVSELQAASVDVLSATWLTATPNTDVFVLGETREIADAVEPFLCLWRPYDRQDAQEVLRTARALTV